MPGLDYSSGCVNFRDVGEWLEVLVGHERYLPNCRLLRGGKLDAVEDWSDVGSPATILNVRRGPDTIKPDWPATWLHVPLPKVPTLAAYDAGHPDIAAWLRQAVGVLGDPDTAYPVLVHCTSGKDRTGMLVAAALAILGVPNEVIVDEYGLSDGGVEPEAIRAFLAGISPVTSFFGRLDLAQVRRRLAGTEM